MSEASHWAAQARRWQFVAAPLRPSAADLEQVEDALGRHLTAASSSNALLCGVTPELARLPIVQRMNLVAIDQSEPMIRAVWPGDTERRRARVGDWFALDMPDASIGVALGDGCFTLLDYPNGYRRFTASLARVLHSQGLFSIRLFCRPAQAESLDEVFRQLFAGTIGNFHVFKWRLAMALQGDDVTAGVPVDRIWRTFQELCSSAASLAERVGYPVDEVLTIDNYRGATASYTYPTVAEVTRQLEPYFELVSEWRGGYELAERCPQLLFRRR